jgi:hypothetical protein
MTEVSSIEKRRRTIINIHTMRDLALSVLADIIDENEDGKQFDYCSSAQLSDEFDALNRTIKKIDKIIYQK